MAVSSGVKDGSEKRKLTSSSHGHPQKRRKGGGNSQSTPNAKKTRRAVSADQLQWREVAIPEMFGDAEGFFGLEEVEGVDVVRSGDTLQFVTVASEEDGDSFSGFDDLPDGANAETASDAANAANAASEDQAPAKPARELENKKKDKRTKDTEAKKSKKDTRELNGKKETKKSTKGPLEGDELARGGGFAMLADLDSDVEGDNADVSAWVPLGLSPPVLSCLAQLGFSKPTAIQTASIPEILSGHDVIGKASTGSGKTLAFGIPIVQAWLATGGAEKKPKPSAASAAAVKATKQDDVGAGGAQASTTCSPTALILSPTRELAHQITTHIKDLCKALPVAPYVCAVTGGLSVLRQQRQLEKADIVVGTPGRLWEVLSTSKPVMEAFKSIAFLVVDEADRLLSEGHFKEAEEILSALDRVESDEDNDAGGGAQAARPRQTLVFSATFNKGLQQKLAGKGRFDLMNKAQSMEHLLKRLNFREAVPKFIDVNPVSQMAERLREGLVECGGMEKDLYLYALLLFQPTRRTLVFTNSISSVRRLTPLLQNLDLNVLPLHSQMAQKARLRSVERFTAAQGDRGALLIATDVAARGLDIPGIDVVIHYHVPRTADNYVHRSGRTARADHGGLSILLCGPEEVTPTRRLVAKIHAASSAKDGKDGSSSSSSKKSNSFYIRTIDLDRRLVARLKERVVLAKKMADSSLAKEKGSKDDSWLRAAADELGVEYDSEDGDLERAGSWSGRGSGRRSREKEARSLSKAEFGALRAQLRQLLATRINAGVSERYLTSGGIDIDALLRGSSSSFLGKVDGLGIDD